jgi:hypothetical protein
VEPLCCAGGVDGLMLLLWSYACSPINVLAGRDQQIDGMRG